MSSTVTEVNLERFDRLAPLTDKQTRRISSLQLGCGWFPEHQGGLERYFHELLQALPNVGVDCRGLVVGSDRIVSETRGAVSAFAHQGDDLFGRWRGIRSASRHNVPSNEFDLSVSHFACYAFPILRRLRNRPLVVHFHGPWAAESRQEGGRPLNVFLKSRVERAVYHQADRLITLSKAFRDILCQQYKIEPSIVRVVPGGVDTNKFADAAAMPRTAARQRLGWPLDRPIILSVRRLMGRMGLENLVQAIGQLRLKHPDLLCLIAGRGRMQGLLETQIASLNLRDHVRLLGFVSDADLPFAYRAADLTIMPSVALEGFGLSAVESFAAGTPALVTPVGGLPEVVEKLSNRLLLPDYHANSLSDAFSSALQNPQSLPDAAACRDYAFREFDWSHVSARIRSVYEEMLR